MSRAMIACLAAVGLTTGAAVADSVNIQGVVSATVGDQGAMYSGMIEYNYIGGSTGELKVSLTNESPASMGGYLTGFLFRADGIDGNDVELTSANPAFFLDTGADSGSPFGQFDGGAALGKNGVGDFLGGGSPSNGLAIGESGMFTFSITSSLASTLSAYDFLGSLSDPHSTVGFLVRFRGLDGPEGSAKVPGSGGDFQVVVPLPGAGAMAAAGLAFVGIRRRR